MAQREFKNFFTPFVCHACGRYFSRGRRWRKPGTIDTYCVRCMKWAR